MTAKATPKPPRVNDLDTGLPIVAHNEFWRVVPAHPNEYGLPQLDHIELRRKWLIGSKFIRLSSIRQSSGSIATAENILAAANDVLDKIRVEERRVDAARSVYGDYPPLRLRSSK